MILPQLPVPTYDAYFYTKEDMQAYALLAIKAVCGGKHRGPKFSGAEVYQIRDMHRNGCGYKQVNKHHPMSEKTFYNIVNKQGAYK